MQNKKTTQDTKSSNQKEVINDSSEQPLQDIQQKSKFSKNRNLLVFGVMLGFIFFGAAGYYLGLQQLSKLSNSTQNLPKSTITQKESKTIAEESNLAEPQRIVIKKYNYKGITISVFVYPHEILKGIYIVKQENTPYVDWGKDGSYNHSIIATKHPLYGDNSFIDIVGNEIVSLDAMSRNINIYTINDFYEDYKTFTIKETLPLPDDFSGLPYKVNCEEKISCVINTAWHFEGGCSGTLLLETGQFENINCGQGLGI